MTVKGSERPSKKTCNTEGCDAWATKQSDRKRCRNCGGESTGPKTEGNQNAMKTGLTSDPVNLFEWLVDNHEEAAAWILNKLYDYSQRAPHAVYEADLSIDDVDTFEDAEMRLTSYGDDVLMMCIRDYARWRATKRQLQEGVISEQEKLTEQGVWRTEDANPVNLELDRMDGTTMRQKDKLGLLPSPESQQASATRELGDVVAEALEPQD